MPQHISQEIALSSSSLYFVHQHFHLAQEYLHQHLIDCDRDLSLSDTKKSLRGTSCYHYTLSLCGGQLSYFLRGLVELRGPVKNRPLSILPLSRLVLRTLLMEFELAVILMRDHSSLMTTSSRWRFFSLIISDL